METLTLEQAYYIGELIAAFVVLVSLVYMAIQLKQNTNAIKLGTAHAVAEEFRGAFSLVASNRLITDSIVKAAREPVELSDAERMEFYNFNHNMILAYQNAYLQMQKGALEIEHWEGMTKMMNDYTNLPGFKEYWLNRKHWTSSSFQQFMDTEIVPGKPTEGVSMVGNY